MAVATATASITITAMATDTEAAASGGISSREVSSNGAIFNLAGR